MNTFIITAGGIGKRMGTNLPKQFLLLKGKPVLLHTLERFHEADPTAQLLITLPNDWLDYWNQLLNNHACNIPHEIISGGIERYDSIKNALKKSTGTIIAVHDGVRPLVSVKTITDCIDSAIKKGSGIPYLSIKESIRKRTTEGSVSLIRSEYVVVQTPQCFSYDTIMKAYKSAREDGFVGTDDSMLVERMGCKVKMIMGSYENIKITTPEDIVIAESILKDKEMIFEKRDFLFQSR